MVGRALALSGGATEQFERQLAADLKIWLLTIPAGVGLATLRASLKLLLGFGPRHSGVYSAGNGPAMRSALIGVCSPSDERVVELVRVSTRLTHIDPKAEEGALLVAQAARLAVANADIAPVEFIRKAAAEVAGADLRETLRAAVQALDAGNSCLEFVQTQGWSNGVSGFVNQTVPAALYCWARSPGDFRQCIENAVLLGGDTDSVAAITGAICGANLGSDAIPSEWVERLREWPRTADWHRRLAKQLTAAKEKQAAAKPPPMHWLATVPRNAVFAAAVVMLGIRRLLPPY